MKKVTSDIKISTSKNASTCTITLEGELTLNNVSTIKKEIVEALEKCDRLQLRIHHATSMDLSCIQLLHSAIKTCKESHQDLSLEMVLNPDAELLFARTGFGSLLQTSKSTNQTIR